MREILFKAKRKDNGKWVEGNLYVMDWESDYVYIIKPYTNSSTLTMYGLIKRNIYLVDKNTVCQYTGLTDKNGNKIWENDIVRNKAKWGDWLGRVVFKNSCFVVEWYKYRKYSEKGISAFTENLINAKEIIGNFFDNADLLGWSK